MTQSLSDIVQVTVEVSPLSTVNSSFNLGLIVGTSTVISATDRVKVYSGTDDMTQNGWAGTEPEYKAAELYFSQSPRPDKVAIGVQDTSNSETLTAAVTACRSANTDWYAVYACDSVAADIEAVAPYIETATPLSAYFYDTQDADVASGTTPNVMDTLKNDSTKRTFGIYSTTTYAGAAVMGRAMGLNTGLANSAYTMAYKSLSGVTPEVLTTTEVTTIKGYNGNVYTTYGASYNLLVQGTMADGAHFDDLLNLDQLTNEIQKSIINTLSTTPKIPQTDAGVGILVSVISDPCEQARKEGFIAPGVWNAAPVLNLQTGDTLSKGYLVLADTVANQSESDRQARKSPPIYVCIKEAGAIENVAIGIVVNQ